MWGTEQENEGHKISGVEEEQEAQVRGVERRGRPSDLRDCSAIKNKCFSASWNFVGYPCSDGRFRSVQDSTCLFCIVKLVEAAKFKSRS